MKRKIIFGLLFAYLVSSTEAHELLRLPLLFKHYQEHREQVADITFWEFLVMHYETDVPHDDQDTRLPFKTRNHSLASTALAVTSQRITLTIPLPVVVKTALSPQHSVPNASYLDEIFQPPRA
ncbi:MAG TPA: hypothetical protein VG737_15670 [Cyclobacteriaceae bacterium]|nr:hypothetical protein [Cyclobacteriaceae bacterium]